MYLTDLVNSNNQSTRYCRVFLIRELRCVRNGSLESDDT